MKAGKKKMTLAERIEWLSDNVWQVGWELFWLVLSLGMMYWVGKTIIEAVFGVHLPP